MAANDARQPTQPLAQQAGQSVGFITAIAQRTGLRVLLGALLAVALLFGLASLTEDVFTNETQQLDNRLELAVHAWNNPALDDFFNVLTTLGSAWGLLAVSVVVGVVLVLLRQGWAIGFLVLAEGGGWLLTELLKILFRRPRPQLWPHEHPLTTFSFPSGHSTVSLCVFGALVYIAWRLLHSRALWAILALLLAALIAGIGLSRVYFGVHYPSDVLAGFLTGGIWLTTLISAYLYLRQTRHLHHKDTHTSNTAHN